MAELANRRGYIYYGCCEGLHDRFEYIEKQISNLRAISISPWSDMYKMGEMLKGKYVFLRKPTPSYISGLNADFSALKDDVENTLKEAKDCSLEFIFRDLYDVDNDISRFQKWVEMTKAAIG